MTYAVLILSLFTTPASAADDPAGEAIGQAWAIGAGGYFGGTTGYLVGETLEANEQDHQLQGVVAGALVGAVVGGTTSALMGDQLDLSKDQAVFLSSGTAVGAYSGYTLGRALIPLEADGGAERAHAAGLAGAMAGTGLAFLGGSPEASSTLHFDLAVGVGAFAGAGVGDAVGWGVGEHRQGRAGFNLAGAATLGGAAAAYNAMANEVPNEAAWGLALGHGAWIGGWTPYLFTSTPDEVQVLGGVRAGMGVGYAGALLIAATGNPTPKSAALQSVGMASASALGAGIPLAVSPNINTRNVAGPMLASGVAGQVLGAAVAPHYDLSQDDVFLLGTLGAWTGYQAAGWAAYATATEAAPHQPVGYALAAGGSGTLLAMGLAPAIDVPASGSAMLLSSGGWGTFYGGWTARMVAADNEQAWLMMMGGGNGALLATAVAEGAGWTPTWKQVGTIDGMGLMGAAGGGLVGVIALYDEDNWDPMVAATLAGTTLGLGAGVVMAARQNNDGGMASTSLPEMELGRSNWQPNVSARPWMDDNGKPGAWVELSLTEVAIR